MKNIEQAIATAYQSLSGNTAIPADRQFWVVYSRTPIVTDAALVRCGLIKTPQLHLLKKTPFLLSNIEDLDNAFKPAIVMFDYTCKHSGYYLVRIMNRCPVGAMVAVTIKPTEIDIFLKSEATYRGVDMLYEEWSIMDKRYELSATRTIVFFMRE
jgi:hypothetical protein